MEDRLFELDVQLLFDAFVLFVVIMIMYAISEQALCFKPVRAFLEQRKQAVAADRDEAQQLQEAAEVSKAAYEEKLKAVHKEAEEILSASRKAAMKQQDAIIDQAKSEASAIMEQADRETVSEKQRIKADVRKEMCGLALAMTGRFADQADPQRGEVLLEEALKEMGGENMVELIVTAINVFILFFPDRIPCLRYAAVGMLTKRQNGLLMTSTQPV